MRHWIEALAKLPKGNDNLFAPGYRFRGVRRKFSAKGYNYQKFDVEFWRGSLLRFLALRPTMSFALYLSFAEEPKFQQHVVRFGFRCRARLGLEEEELIYRRALAMFPDHAELCGLPKA